MSTIAYWLLYAVTAVGVLSFSPPRGSMERIVWVVLGVFLIVGVGLRHEVGGDWLTYQGFNDGAKNLPFQLALSVSDLGYAAINWLGANSVGTPHFVNGVCAVLAVVPLMMFCRTRKNPWLSLTVAVPYLIIVVFMGYTRQSAAMGLSMMAVMQLEKRHFWRALAFIFCASLFHWSALGIALCVATLSAVPMNWRNMARSVFIIFVSLGFAWLLLYAPTAIASSIGLSAKVDGYLLKPAMAELHSAGALPRLALTVLAGGALLLAIDRRHILEPAHSVWALYALGSFLLFPLALFHSTLADRIGLFLMPLQLHAVSLLDDKLDPAKRVPFRVAVMVVCGTMLFFWLQYSSYARYWVPYDNIISQLF